MLNPDPSSNTTNSSRGIQNRYYLTNIRDGIDSSVTPRA